MEKILSSNVFSEVKGGNIINNFPTVCSLRPLLQVCCYTCVPSFISAVAVTVYFCWLRIVLKDYMTQDVQGSHFGHAVCNI